MILPGLKTHEARLHGKGGPRRMSTYLSLGLQLACQPTWASAFNRHPVLLVQSRCLHSSSRHGEMREVLECMHVGKSIYRYPGTVAPAVELPNSGCIKSLLDLLTSVDVFSLSRSRIAWVGASRLGPSCFTQPIVCQRIRGGIPVASCTTVQGLVKDPPQLLHQEPRLVAACRFRHEVLLMDLGLSWQGDCPRRGDVGPIPTGGAPEA